MIVDLALSATGSQVIASVLPTVDFSSRSESGSLCWYLCRLTLTRISMRYSMNVSRVISLLSGVARTALKLSGCCEYLFVINFVDLLRFSDRMVINSVLSTTIRSYVFCQACTLLVLLLNDTHWHSEMLWITAFKISTKSFISRHSVSELSWRHWYPSRPLATYFILNMEPPIDI